ncbi:MAG: hypothetical protein F4026_04145 [Synechococcus sp. SB0669_bin_8]|nr:hypothetical protein [Synechococcus sp. SB0663_bin_10]MYG47500.1 hypothetical protein [Synechococcus sp. SB0675_bin_6]MYK91332.1 hypothetical protein [Synechococcus sp. SB0669_bin_8]
MAEVAWRHGNRMDGVVLLPMASWRAALLMTFVVLVFGLTLFVVSARIWLPTDMAAPAPVP